jgi:hypothetical protein
MYYDYIEIPFESTLDRKQPNIDSGDGRERIIIKNKSKSSCGTHMLSVSREGSGSCRRILFFPSGEKELVILLVKPELRKWQQLAC